MKFLFLMTYMKGQGRWQLLSMAQIFSIDPTDERCWSSAVERHHELICTPSAR